MNARPRAPLVVTLVVVGVLVIAGPYASARPSPVRSSARVSAGGSLLPDAPLPHSGPTLSWTNLTSTAGTGPSPRASAGVIYDSADGYLLLFGGESLGLRYLLHNDTWKFAHGVWTNITGGPAPSPRFGFQLADDLSDGVVVLFGGQGAGPGETYLNDTWEFHAGVWTNVTAGVAPPGRFWGSMSYDNQTGTVILFGGKEGPGPAEEFSNDTWSFHDGAWTELHPTALPPGRNGQTQVNAPGDGGVVVFGGLNLTEDLNDTWTYASGTWTATGVATAPDARTGAGMAFDAAFGAVVMYGGYPANDYPYATWLLSDGSWTRYSVTPSPPDGTAWGQLAYDPAVDEVLYFQGNGLYNATWALTIAPGTGGGLEIGGSVLPASGSEPLEVTCQVTATGGTSPYAFAWTFGDGTTSAVENTSHLFSRVGTFQVNVSVTDFLGSEKRLSWNVTVLAAGSGGTPTALGPIELYAGIAAAFVAAGIAGALVARRRRRARPPGPAETPPGSGTPPSRP